MTLVPNIKEIHVEPTSVCQAECPMCPRTLLGYHNDHSKNDELDLDTFVSLVDPYVDGLDKILFCGVLGEPAAAKDLIAMIRWVLSKNPNITIGINTNGGLKSVAWWIELADLIKHNIKSYVVFSIDGLEDTNHVYRKNVSWDKLIENANAYIKAGGNAQWDSLIFRHNQHQISAMRDLAKELGFKIFRTKVSSRDIADPRIDFPEEGKPKIVAKSFSCMAQDTDSLYLSAKGTWYPCCFIHQHHVLGGSDWGDPLLDVNDRNDKWSDLEHRINASQGPPICVRSCGSTHNTGQWTNEDHF